MAAFRVKSINDWFFPVNARVVPVSGFEVNHIVSGHRFVATISQITPFYVRKIYANARRGKDGKVISWNDAMENELRSF